MGLQIVCKKLREFKHILHFPYYIVLARDQAIHADCHSRKERGLALYAEDSVPSGEILSGFIREMD